MTNHDENSNNRDNKSSASPSSTPTISTAIATTPVKNSTTNTSTADLSYSPDLSPNVMVEKAVKNAMEEQKKQQEQQDKAELDLDLHLNLNLTASTNNDTGKNTDTSIIVNEEDNNRKRPQLEDIWSRHQKKGCNREEAIQETWKLMSKYVDELIQDGILAHQEWERAEQRLKILQEDCTAKGRELERLRASDQKTRESISNLLRAVQTSNEETKDQAQAKLVEARMRADILQIKSERDQALGDLAGNKRRSKSIKEDLSLTKFKLSKAQQEKMQLERDQRATLSLAKSLQGNVHSSVDYYKRKVTELNAHVQGLSAVLTEKNRQIEDLRRQMERNMSQNRLAAFRSLDAADRKKKRVSY